MRAALSQPDSKEALGTVGRLRALAPPNFAFGWNKVRGVACGLSPFLRLIARALHVSFTATICQRVGTPTVTCIALTSWISR